MNIGFVTPRFNEGDMRGGEELTRSLVNYFAPKHNVQIFTSTSLDVRSQYSLSGLRTPSSELLLDNGALVTRLKTMPFISAPFHKFNDLLDRLSDTSKNVYRHILPDIVRVIGWGPLLRGFKEVVKSRDIDVLHASLFPTTSSYQSLITAKKYSIPFVFTPFLHYRMPNYSQSALLASMMKRCSAVIACTPYEKEAITSMGIDGEKVHVIPLSFDTIESKEMSIPKLEAKKQLGVENKFVVLTHPWVSKGAATVLRSIAKISGSYKDITLLTIGKPDKVFLEVSTSLSKSYPNLDVRNLGWVQLFEKWRAFSASDVFVLPSLNDAFGMSYLNAWASNRPIIGASNTAVEYLVDEGKNGFLIHHDDVNSLSSLLISMVESTIDIDFMGTNGYEKLINEFSGKKMGSRYDKVFNEVMS